MVDASLVTFVGGVAPPVNGKPSLYVNGSNEPIYRDPANVERNLVGTIQPLAQFDGTGPAIVFQNAGIASIIRKPAGNPAGDYRVTFSSPITGNLVAPPGISSGRLPIIVTFAGAANPAIAEAKIVGGGFPFTQVDVELKDVALAHVDGYFTLTLMPF